MTDPEILEPGSSGRLARAPAEDVPLMPRVEEVDLGWEVATGRIDANSLRMTASAQGNTQADMPDWMAGSIDAVHANIGREHGLGSPECKASLDFHDGSDPAPQAELASEVELVGRTLLGTRYFERHKNKLYLYTDDTVYEVDTSFNTNGTAEYEIHRNKITDHHYTVFTNFVLTGSDDIHVTGHTGNQTINYHFSLYSVQKWFMSPPVPFAYAGNSGNNTFEMTWGSYKIDLSAGGNNLVNMTGGIAREIIGGGGDDTINISGATDAHAELIDLTNGGNNSVHTERSANIIGGAGNDTIESQPTFQGFGKGIDADLSAGGDNTVILRGAKSAVTLGAGNDTITVTNEWNNVHPGNWSSARIDLSLGGNNLVRIDGNTHTSGPTVARITLGHGDDTIHAGDHTVVTILGAHSSGNDTITLNGSVGWQGEVHTGEGHTDLTVNSGGYDIHLGSGSVSMSVNGHAGFSTFYDAEGNLIVGRVDGQSSVAEAVHTFSAGEGINLHYSLQLGYGVDKVQFYAGSGHYQVTSSANRDIFQLDFEAGGTEGATYEVFDFKWGTDRIMAANGTVFDEHLLTDGNTVRLQYLGEENGQHAFDVVALWDFGAYEAGHVWMTVYSNDLPDLNFL